MLFPIVIPIVVTRTSAGFAFSRSEDDPIRTTKE